MDAAEMEQLLSEIAAEIDPRAVAIESGNHPYITFTSPYSAPAGWVGLGKWSQRFYPIGEDRAEITEQFTDWLSRFSDGLPTLQTVQQVADLYRVSRQSINTRAARLRKSGPFGQEVGGVWLFTPKEVERLRPGPAGRPTE